MKKFLLYFFLVFYALELLQWSFMYSMPGLYVIMQTIHEGEAVVVHFLNNHLLHVKPVLNEMGGGSGDTSYDWARWYTLLILAAVISIIWVLIENKKTIDLTQRKWFLLNMIRYYIAGAALGYGIIKIFCLQMPPPNYSQLATPLGDYLPMRFLWMFMGYSTPYQTFSGVMEFVAGLLLLNRKTVLLGVLMATGAFANVFMLNLSYDVPVKQYSMLLFLSGMILLFFERKRLLQFFMFNQIAEPTTLWDFQFAKKWQRIVRMAAKFVFILVMVILYGFDAWSTFQENQNKANTSPIPAGVYDIQAFVKNNDTVPYSKDAYAWKDFIFDSDKGGSIQTKDSMFRQRYGRGYFLYQVDSTQNISFSKSMSDTAPLFQLQYKWQQDSSLMLWGKLKTDSVKWVLKKSNRHFQLMENQFHWISEANR